MTESIDIRLLSLINEMSRFVDSPQGTVSPEMLSFAHCMIDDMYAYLEECADMSTTTASNDEYGYEQLDLFDS